MTTVNTHEAKTHLSRLLDRVLAGEDIVVARDGLPIARLIPYQQAESRPPFGFAQGDFEVADTFFEPLPADELARWNR